MNKPQVPDPTVVAKSGADSVKAVAQGVIEAGNDIASGVEQILFNTAVDGVGTLSTVAKDIVKTLKNGIDTGRNTVNKVKGDIDQAVNRVQQDVDQGLGQEVVKKFITEVDKQLPR